jgi:hypothetical protein
MQGEVRFAVLGRVRAWRGEAELDLRHPKQLAALLVREGAQASSGSNDVTISCLARHAVSSRIDR